MDGELHGSGDMRSKKISSQRSRKNADAKLLLSFEASPLAIDRRPFSALKLQRSVRDLPGARRCEAVDLFVFSLCVLCASVLSSRRDSVLGTCPARIPKNTAKHVNFCHSLPPVARFARTAYANSENIRSGYRASLQVLRAPGHLRPDRRSSRSSDLATIVDRWHTPGATHCDR